MYLSQLSIQNFRGIKDMTINFDKSLNVVIGANGHYKTAIMDAIRLFYSWGDSFKDRNLEISKEDFHISSKKDKTTGQVTYITASEIRLHYVFAGLNDNQQAALYQYLIDENGMFSAVVDIVYKLSDKDKITYSYVTGAGMKADYETFQYFRAYYLSALRDSTRDMLSFRNNPLSKVIQRKIETSNAEQSVKDIIKQANNSLLERPEVKGTRDGINNNLKNINQTHIEHVGLHVEESRLEYIVNVIRPFLPYEENSDEGFLLSQNSLGFNNLIYIATVLSDIEDSKRNDDITDFILLIEEPEAHLHPQLQLSLYRFLKSEGEDDNCQTFITSHSPTLTSQIPLNNLILVKNNQSVMCIGDCFKDRESEGIVQDVKNNKKVTNKVAEVYKRQLTRYLDVSRSQLFFSNGCVLVEGISEAQLLEAFSRVLNKSLIEHQIELINTNGIAFYQFLMLFNSSAPNKRLDTKIAVITDADQFTNSKDSDYNLDKLVENDYVKLQELKDKINTDEPVSRIKNLKSMSSGQLNTCIMISSGDKTLEYQICLANVFDTAEETKAGLLYKLIKSLNPKGIANVDDYISTKITGNLSSDQKQDISILLWKCLPGKAEFAHYLEDKVLSNLNEQNPDRFVVPPYIQNAINFLIPC